MTTYNPTPLPASYDTLDPFIRVGSPTLLDEYKDYQIIVVKPNVDGADNVLTLQMLSLPNTKYIIRYHFTIRPNPLKPDDDIVMPANSILEFDGGSISSPGKLIAHYGDTLRPCTIKGIISDGIPSIIIDRNGVGMNNIIRTTTDTEGNPLQLALTGTWRTLNFGEMEHKVLTEDQFEEILNLLNPNTLYLIAEE